MNTPFQVKKGEVIEAGEGSSFTAKRDGMAYWEGDELLMLPHPNETPEPLAGPSVESCATALAEALRREKGWLLDYADSVIRDAIDRKHLEPLAQEQAGEMPEPAGFRSRYRSEPEMIGHYPWTYADSERRRRKYDRPECDYEDLYTAEQMREYRSAALQAKDAEIAGLKADAGRLDWLSGRDLNDLAVGYLEGKVLLNIGCGDIFEGDDLRGAIDHARKYGQPS